MYTQHFGLTTLPFENVPDPKFFFDEGDHARIHSRIKESLIAGRGLIVVTGPIGSGKTTLSQMIISEFSLDIRLIWIAEPPKNSIDLFLFIAQELNLNPSTSERTFVLRDIRDALLKIHSENSKCLVIIDESHLMSDDVIINGIRILNNLEEGSTKLIQILLLGQEELMNKINRAEMEPFKQRIATLEILGKMEGDRIRKYVSHRIQVAGGQVSIFADTGWEALTLAFGSEGVPRLINSLCDRSLSEAFEKGKTGVDVDDVYKAAEGMGLQKEIFFYRIELKNKEREQQIPSVMENDSNPETTHKEPIHSMSNESNRTGPENTLKQSEIFQSTYKGSKIGFFASAMDRENLKIPALCLLLSITAFILSISFYCHRSDSPDVITCLVELIGFR